jgi:polyribonucleotide nucleotidyltransferase
MRFHPRPYGCGRADQSPVAGIAMGLIKDVENSKISVMSDIPV